MFRNATLLLALCALGCVHDDGPFLSEPTPPTIEPRPGDIPRFEPDELPTLVRHTFAHIQPWSRDGRYFLAYNIGTEHAHVLTRHLWTTRRKLPNQGHRWIGGSAHILAMKEDKHRGAVLFRIDMETGQGLDPLLLDHPSIHIPRSFRETSRDGQWVAVFVDKGRNGTPHILTVDLDAREVVVDRPVHDFGCNQDPKWVGVDPDGDFLLVQSSVAGEALCQGLWAYDIETGTPVRQITNHTHIGALGRDPLGDPYFLSMEIPFPDEGIFATPTRYRFDGTQKVPVGPSVPVDSMEHISCTGDAGDACLISARWDGGGAYEGQLWWLSYNGAHLIQGPHHAGGCHIWGNAQAVVGPEGQYAYATHDGSCANVRSVIVDP